ncbi:MAG: hypothetical protein Kow0074_23100 [Candidatus Zixiibacteriota bacterium]
MNGTHPVMAILGLVLTTGSLAVISIVVLTLAVAILLIALVRQSNKSRKALETLAETASRLSQGDLNARIPIDPYRESDAYSELAFTFNRMADEMKLRFDRSRHERDQLQTVLANMSDGVIAVDGQGIVRLVNRAFLKYFRTVFDSPIGKTYSEAFRQRGLTVLIEELLEGRASDVTELVVNEPTRRILVLRSATIPEADHASDVRGVVVARDVTARRRVEQMRRDFVANVSHELRTPLTAILGYLEALKDTRLGPNERADFLEIVSRNATRMNRIVADLLELSRIEAPDYKPEVTRFALRPIIEEVGVSVQALMAAKSQTFSTKLDPAVGTIEGDRDAVYRIIFNLTDNAHKYTPDGGHITVVARRHKDDLVLSVEDDGIGVPENDRPRLFERFFRVDRARSRASGGTGLGLAIVKHLAEAMGGTVAYEPNIPRGSRFIVTIPQKHTQPSGATKDD